MCLTYPSGLTTRNFLWQIFKAAVQQNTLTEHHTKKEQEAA